MSSVRQVEVFRVNCLSKRLRLIALVGLIPLVLAACTSQNTTALQLGPNSTVKQDLNSAKYASIRSDDGLVAQFGCKENFVTTPKTGLVAQRQNPGDQHYIEFRVRVTPAIPSGHMHVVYGELDENQIPKTFNYVGLLPKGSIFGLYAGIFVPVGISGELEPSVLDCVVKPSMAYRVTIDSEKYTKLLAHVARHRANPPDWRMLSYNCNHFAAGLGQTVGLKAPRGVRSRQFLSTIYFNQFLRANGETVRSIF